MKAIIRQETIQELELVKNNQLLLRLTEASEKFCQYDFGEASSVIFKLLYEDNKDIRERAFQDFKFTLSSEISFDQSLDYYFLTEEVSLSVAEELQVQYLKAHPSFLRVRDCPGCDQELKTLKSKLEEKHPLLLFRAVESVRYAYQDEKNVSGCVKLLLSENSKDQRQGLQQGLKHNYKYSMLLLPYSKEIGDLLQAMHNVYMAKQRVMAAQEELNSSFAPLAKLLDKFPVDSVSKVDAVPATNVAPTNDVEPAPEAAPTSKQPSSNPVSPSFIKEYSLSAELSNLIANKDTLLAVLTAHENLENFTTALINAKKKFDEANANYSTDDFNTLHTLFAAGKAFEDAKVTYNAAYDSFIEYRDAFEARAK